ncbi:MAG: hypothetical protein AUJ75_04625 [Candidatus Omnitrophica bacterium CG1_02_49_10]|nr:MAG: hypothetical protein AUJ75_04625 [Candidatus Omnitrophica bacterium CG1_02_49_10]
MENCRVRFAPSPTGYLHLGSARTALFNWCYARHTGGKLVLRIEDTDRERSKKAYLDEILDDLRWMGLDWDEGPYFQSESFDIYRKAAEEIVDKGLAYREGEAIIYRVEKGRVIAIDDLIHSRITFSTDDIKDQVLIKSDGSPAYNFACVVDDGRMNITHVIRGDDHISNTPKQIILYEAMGFKKPHFAHIPLVMGTDGAKLSKRHGGVSVYEYRKEGFLPQAVANYLLLLGWSMPNDKEIFSLESAASQFGIEDVTGVQAKFDIDKLRWLNAEYIKASSAGELLAPIMDMMREAGYIKEGIDEKYISNLIELYKTRFRTLSEFVSLSASFFRDDYKMDEAAVAKHLKDEKAKELIKVFAEHLKGLEAFTASAIEDVCRSTAASAGVKAGDIIHPARVAISGLTVGAGLFEMMEVLGKDRTIGRLERAAS